MTRMTFLTHGVAPFVQRLPSVDATRLVAIAEETAARARLARNADSLPFFDLLTKLKVALLRNFLCDCFLLL